MEMLVKIVSKKRGLVVLYVVDRMRESDINKMVIQVVFDLVFFYKKNN